MPGKYKLDAFDRVLRGELLAKDAASVKSCVQALIEEIVIENDEAIIRMKAMQRWRLPCIK
jgi:hypothetical protein